MKGKVIETKHRHGVILGDDGNEYFYHESNCVSTNIKKSNIVMFNALSEYDYINSLPVDIKEKYRLDEIDIDISKRRLRADKVVKMGFGKHHPFIQDLLNVRQHILSAKSPNVSREEVEYRIRDIDRLINYFTEVEDIEFLRSYNPSELDIRKKFKIRAFRHEFEKR